MDREGIAAALAAGFCSTTLCGVHTWPYIRSWLYL